MPENEIDEIADRIIRRRKELGFSYQDLADKTGLNKSTLMRYEKGTIKSLPVDKIKNIAQALNVSPSYLMGIDEDKHDNVSDVKEAMKVIMAQPGLMLNGEILSDESKIALANAINMGLAYAEQMQKKASGKK